MRSRFYALAIAVLLPSCGGGGGGTTTATPPTTLAACMQTVLFQGSAPVPVSTGVIQDFSVTSTVATRLDVLVDWTSSSSPIGVYVTQGACSSSQLNAGQCTFLIRSDPSTQKPRRVSASNVAPGAYTLVIANFGTLDEAVAAQVVLSSTTCPPLAGAEAGPRQ